MALINTIVRSSIVLRCSLGVLAFCLRCVDAVFASFVSVALAAFASFISFIHTALAHFVTHIILRKHLIHETTAPPAQNGQKDDFFS